MAIPSFNGVLDTATETIITTNATTWEDLGAGDSAGQNTIQTWEDWTSWTPEPVTPLTWATLPIDFGSKQFFNITWNIVCEGVPTFTVYTSLTGAFAGEETATTVSVGDTDIEAFYGQYVILFISVAQQDGGGPPSILSFNWETNARALNITQYDVDSSTLNGATNAREIVMPRTVSKVLSINLTAQATEYVADSYVAIDYVDDTAPVFPNIVSKTRTAPQITFITTSGTKSDAIFDLAMTALPEQFMDGNNLSIR